METGYIALGILCILYYICLVWHTKRWNSTLSVFWIFCGLWNVGIGVLVCKTPDFVDYIILGASIIIWLTFLIVEILILCAMLAIPKKKLKYIVILGAQIRGKRITNALERRLKKGLEYLQENPETLCIVSGGKGKGEDVPEAEVMAEYLKANGIDEKRIYVEDKSETTWENLEFSQRFIDDVEQDMVGIVTNNFHIYRSMKIAEMLGYKRIFAIPASVNMIVFPNYMTREFLALGRMIFLEVKSRIKI